MTKEQKYVSETDVIQYIKEQEVVTWDLLEERFGITRVALWRKLLKHKKITSLNKNSKYFTMLKFVEDKIDNHGMWKHGDMTFSIHGGACNTIKYLVNKSSQGTKCKDIDLILNMTTRPHLLKLIREGKIVRGKISREWVYFSSNENVRMQQLNKREIQDRVEINMLQTEKSTTPQKNEGKPDNTNIKLDIAWKEKAKKRRLENRFLKQRLKELTISRDLWKNKYKGALMKWNELGESVMSKKKFYNA